MKPGELSSLTDLQLLDVRLADDFEAAHLSGAENNCVFEVAFVERLGETAPRKDLPTVVYGANGCSSEASMADEKLRRQGYSDIRILEGGLEAAETAGLPIERGNPLPSAPSVPEGTLPIDLEESRVEWLGRNLLNKHWGTAALESGHLTFAGGQLTGGEFVIDLARLKSEDLKDSPLHDVLIDHLHSDDFFDVGNHPKATFVITQAQPTCVAHPGSPNLHLVGDLTLRGQTHPIQFDASAGLTPEGKPAAQAAFSIDRTGWGILYGSGKFFHRLAGHVVNDLLEFQIRIVTQ